MIPALIAVTGITFMAAMDEVNAWRRHVGLPEFKEDPELTAFAQMKAEYRAKHRLKDGHQGPKWPDGCTEGTGEALPEWGWLTCAIECEGTYAGAGVAMAGGERYMVFVLRNAGRPLIIPCYIPILDTSHLTPSPPVFD